MEVLREALVRAGRSALAKAVHRPAIRRAANLAAQEVLEATSTIGVRSRMMYRWRLELPHRLDYSIDARPFRPATDIDAVLDVSRRAFAWHPEQRLWDEAAINALLRSPTYHPDDFLVHAADGRVVAYCHSSVQDGRGVTVGRVEALAADPALPHKGVAWNLGLAAMDRLAARGAQVATFYCEANNVPINLTAIKGGAVLDRIVRFPEQERLSMPPAATGPGVPRAED